MHIRQGEAWSLRTINLKHKHTWVGWCMGMGKPMGFAVQVWQVQPGTVSDLPTHGNTVPVTGYPQVSATHSHTCTHQVVCLSHAFNGKLLTLSLAPAIS